MLRHVCDPLDSAKGADQVFRRPCADMADAQAEQEFDRIGRAFCFDSDEEIVDRLFFPPLTRQQFVAVQFQPENISRAVQPPQPEELDNRLVPQPLDVERAARHEMFQPLDALRGTDQAAGAADIDFAFFGNSFGLAFGARRWKDECSPRHIARQVFDDLRDDVACPLHDHPVANANAKPRDLVAIVERYVRHDDATNRDGFQPPDWCQFPCAADLNVDGL